jgi:hypothetical protein
MIKLSALVFIIWSCAFGAGVQAKQIRNMSAVVSGKIYRAGTTNRKPYNDDTLRDLCEDGFTVAIYLYGGAKSHSVSCGGGRTIRYMSITSYQKIDPVTNVIENAVDHGGKAVFHCWNGVHATGFIAGAVLNRFCGYSGREAANYFERGVPKGSLAQSAINKLSNILESQPSGGRVMQGCP